MKDRFTLIAACLLIILGTSTAYRVLCAEQIHFRRGEAMFARMEYDLAVEHYRHALDRGLHKQVAFIHMTEAQLALGLYDDAKTTAQSYSKSRTFTPETTCRLAEIFVGFGRFDVAIQLLAPVVTRTPEHRKARFRLAQLLTWTQAFDEAIEHYNILLGDKL